MSEGGLLGWRTSSMPGAKGGNHPVSAISSGERNRSPALRASLKRASTSAPPDERSEPKRANSAVELEAIEARGDCFRHLEGSPLSWWKGVVSKGDIAFFQAGVTYAQRVSISVFVVRVGFSFNPCFFVVAGVCEGRAKRQDFA